MTDEFKKAMSTQRYGASSAAGGGNIGSQLSTGVPNFITYKFKTEEDFKKSKLNKNISFETGSFKPWLSKDITSKFIPTKMPKLNDNMNITYANRREHLHDWMKAILIMNGNKGIFQYNGGIEITGTTVFPTDDDEFSTIGKISQNNYGDGYVKLYSLKTSGNNDDCAFHAFLQAISPLFRSLNIDAKNFVANEFRRDYILNVIVNEKGAPLKDFDTKEYLSDSESISIRDAYNGVEIINSKYVYFRDYLGDGNKFTDFAPIELVGFNSKFFGYNYLAMSLLTTNEQNKGNEKKYEYVPINQIFGDINETIIVGNKYSVHFETICSNVDGVYKFIFNKNENFLKNFIVPELKLYDPANIEINGIKSKVLERKIMIFENDNHIIIYLVTPINDHAEYNFKFNEDNFENFLNSETLTGITELTKRKKNNKKMSNLCLIAVDNINNASYLLIDYTKDKNKNKDKYKLLKLNENSVDLKFNPDDVKATHDLYEENGHHVLKKISKATVSVNEAELYNKNGWYNKNIDADKLPLPVLNADNMEETYKNRRDHLTNWMITILTTAPKELDFRICNQKQTSDENDLPIKNNVYLSPINAGTIRNLNFVDYYAFDYNEKSQANFKFLNPPKFGFVDKNKEFVDITKYNFHQMNASGDDNSCGFFALLQAISPLYRALNSPAKLHITRIFRNRYVPQIIVNKNGAPMSTTAYKPAVMGGDAQTNELEMIRAGYNTYDSETSGKYNLIEYLNGSQNTQPTRASMHIINSRFFGYNMVSISKVKQSYTSGKYKFFKDEIQGPEKVTSTILICNIVSVHYMTIGVKNETGKMNFIFDETDEKTQKMINAISFNGTAAADVVTNLETGLTFNDVKFEEIFRKIISDTNKGGNAFYIVFNKPIGNENFSTELDKTLHGMKVYNDYISDKKEEDENFEVDPNKILCYAINVNTQEYYYVLSYKISYGKNEELETWKVAKITKNGKDLTVKDSECGTISYDNKNGNVKVNLDKCANVTKISKKKKLSSSSSSSEENLKKFINNVTWEKVDKDRLEREKAEKDILDREKAEKDRLDREKAEKDRLDREKAEKERLDREKAERDRLDREKSEKDRLDREKAEKDRLDREKSEKDRLDREKAEKDRLDIEKAEKDRLDIEKAEKDRLDREKAEKDRLDREKAEKDRLDREKAEKDREKAKENTCFVRIKFIKNDENNEFDVGEIDTELNECNASNTQLFPNKISEIIVDTFYLFKFELNTNELSASNISPSSELSASNISPSSEQSDIENCKTLQNLNTKLVQQP